MISRKEFCKLLGLSALLLGTTPLRSGDALPPNQPPVQPPASPPSPEKAALWTQDAGFEELPHVKYFPKIKKS